MSDLESSVVGGTKRKHKHKENAFTAKAESGTLKVKILRRDQQVADTGIEALASTSTSSTSSTAKTRSRRARQPPPNPDSPPKPRPNRKHVPIFYQQAHLDQVKRANSHSHSSSTDDSAHSSTTGVPGTHSTSSLDVDAASTSSTTSSQLAGRFSTQLSTSGDLGLPPTANPLFSRNDSDGMGSLGDLLRPYFPSPSSGLNSNFPRLGTQPMGTTSSAGLLLDQAGPSSALHQLASSSASYRSALDALSSTAYGAASSGSESTSSAVLSMSSTDATSSTSSTTRTQALNGGGLENYRFDPLAALQSAIEQARRVSSATKESVPAKPQHQDSLRDIGSPNGNSRYFRLEPSGSSGTVDTCNDASNSRTASLDTPALPPSFVQQDSLVGGGIHTLNPLKLRSKVDGNKNATSSPSSKEGQGNDAKTTLGSPPDAPPSFLLQNSLVGGGISVVSRPKSHLSLSRLCSVTSVTSDDGESIKGIHLPGLHTATSTQDSGSASTSAADGASSSSETVDLGPPPSGPPAFTIGNSLMGGGIELQPAATHVNTHNFDWKLHKSASTSGENVTTSPAGRSKLGLRVRRDSELGATTSHHKDAHKS